MLNVAAVALGVLLIAAGVSFVYRPAGMIVVGLACAAAGLLLDDGR